MRFRLFVCTCVLAVAAACGSGSAHPHKDEPIDPNAPQLAMVAKSFSFEPEKLTFPAGTKRTLVMSVKDIPHDFTIDELDIHLHGNAGATVRRTLTFDKPGTYKFVCSIAGHREAGMFGTLTVT